MRLISILVLNAVVWLASSVSHAEERRWLRTDGVPRYLVLHSEDKVWHLDLVEEPPRKLPSLLWSRVYRGRTEALAAASGVAERERMRPAPSMSLLSQASAVTEVRTQSIWEVRHEWSQEWEERYTQWISTEVDETFMERNQLATDCADVAFTLRWVFARIHGLPAANRLSGSGVLFSQDSMRAAWAALPTHEDWRKDRRFRAALDYLLDLTYTHSLMRDSYPVALRAGSFAPGTHVLYLGGDSGHTLMLLRLDVSEQAAEAVEVISSTTPREVRKLYRHGYWDSRQPKPGSGGLLRMRWPVPSGARGRVLAAPETHPYYSNEQYEPEFMEGQAGFAEAILIRLNPSLDFRKRLANAIDDVKKLVSERVQVVLQGHEACKRMSCAPGSDGYEAWSTPSRDHRLAEHMDQIEDLVKRKSATLDHFSTPWLAALSGPVVEIEGQTYSLGAVRQAWALNTYSVDPREPVQRRWGLRADYLVGALKKEFQARVSERATKITEQGDRCSAPGACVPSSADWEAWTTREIDGRMRALGFRVQALRQYLSAEQASLFDQALRGESVNLNGEPVLIEVLLDRMDWLVSDPRSPWDDRWGSQRARYLTRSFVPGTELEVAANGLGKVSPSDEAASSVIRMTEGAGYPVPTGSKVGGFDTSQGLLAVIERNEGQAIVRVLGADGKALDELRMAASDFPKDRLGFVLPGVLAVRKERARVLLDLNFSPPRRTEWAISSSDQSSIAGVWLEKTAEHDSWVLRRYAGGELKSLVVQGAAPGRQLLEVDRQTERFYVSDEYRCVQADCAEERFVGSILIDKKDGRILRPWPEETIVGFVSKDGRLVLSRNLKGCTGVCPVEQWELSDEGVAVKKAVLGTGYWLRGVPRGEGAYIRIQRSEKVVDVYAYRQGKLERVVLALDETEILDVHLDHVLVALASGGERFRPFAGGAAVIETGPGSAIMPIISRDHPERSAWALVGHGAELRHYTFHDLLRPGSGPIFDGTFPRTLSTWTTTGGHQALYSYESTQAMGYVFKPQGDEGNTIWIANP